MRHQLETRAASASPRATASTSTWRLPTASSIGERWRSAVSCELIAGASLLDAGRYAAAAAALSTQGFGAVAAIPRQADVRAAPAAAAQ